MANIKRPQVGERVLQSLYDSVNSIIDYLPTLTVRGDNYSTYIEHSSLGTIVHAKQPANPDQGGGKSNYYYAGSGIHLVSGNVFQNALSGDGRTIAINHNVISCLVSPSGGGGPDTNTTYTGELNVPIELGGCPSGWIWVDPTPFSGDTHIIYSNLRYLVQLWNDPLISDGTISIREDRISDAIIYPDHFLQTKDIIYNKGINAQITSGSWIQNVSPDAIIDPDTGETIQLKHWSGLQVDCVLTGGRYTQVNNHWGTSELDPDDHTINSLLSGDNSHIFITDQTVNEDGSWGGIISTNIHGDGTTVTMDADGTLHAIGGGGGGGVTSSNYIFSSGIYQTTANSRYIIRYPHIPIAWSEDEPNPPWPEGWQPPKEPGMDEYISQQWPLYQFYYDQPADPPLPCGYLCSTYRWAQGDYSFNDGHWDILLKLPNVNERTTVEVINYTYSALAVVTDNGKQIIPQSFNNTVGDSQHQYAIQYPNTLYSFNNTGYNATFKMIFYYDPAPPTGVERNPYSTAAVQLFSGGCWYAQMFCD